MPPPVDQDVVLLFVKFKFLRIYLLLLKENLTSASERNQNILRNEHGRTY
jgi:hypothetical protein